MPQTRPEIMAGWKLNQLIFQSVSPDGWMQIRSRQGQKKDRGRKDNKGGGGNYHVNLPIFGEKIYPSIPDMRPHSQCPLHFLRGCKCGLGPLNHRNKLHVVGNLVKPKASHKNLWFWAILQWNLVSCKTAFEAFWRHLLWPTRQSHVIILTLLFLSNPSKVSLFRDTFKLS